jgi:hypothetical protein
MTLDSWLGAMYPKQTSAFSFLTQHSPLLSISITVTMFARCVLSFSCFLVGLLGVPSLANAATTFAAPRGSSVICGDSLANVCKAPTSCNRNGQITLDSGNNFNIGSPSTTDGIWQISGGYKITFPTACNITCDGDCKCEGCPTIETPKATSSDGGSAPTSSNGGSAPTASKSPFSGTAETVAMSTLLASLAVLFWTL